MPRRHARPIAYPSAREYAETDCTRAAGQSRALVSPVAVASRCVAAHRVSRWILRIGLIGRLGSPQPDHLVGRAVNAPPQSPS